MLRQLLCVMLIVLLLVTCLLAVGCAKKEVSQDPEPDQQALGKDLINKAPADPGDGENAGGEGD